MNRKHLLFGTAALLAMASCSNDELNNITPGNGDAEVIFNLNVPAQFSTRTIGDGNAATDIQVLVFEDVNSTPIYKYSAQSVLGPNGSGSVTLNLLAKNDYTIIFFAYSPNAAKVYTLSDNGLLSVNYAEMNADNNSLDAYDCFYSAYELEGATSGTSVVTVSMTRPVAQINWGANDVDAKAGIFGNGGAYIQSRLTCTPYTSLNLLTGQGTLANAQMTFPIFTIPTDEAYPVNPEVNTYIAYQYLLAPATPTNMEMILSISNAGNGETTGESAVSVVDVSLENAPVQANYQTNVYGALLSEGPFTVTKDAWTSPNFVPVPKWDGTTATEPSIDYTNQQVTLNRPSDLAGLANLVNGKSADGTSDQPNDIAGYTILLDADFDMNGYPFPGIGSATRSGSGVTNSTNSFKGTFDGQGHTIKNLTINGTTNPDDAAGFIGNVDGGTVKNVIFENINIDASDNEQAGVIGLATNNATISGITVKSGSITAKEAPGGIVGRMMLQGTITKCENHASIESVTTNAGGIVGAAYRTSTTGTVTVSECKNYGPVSGKSQGVGGIVGLSSAVISKCTNEGPVTGGTTSTGGIVGQQNSAGRVTECINQADITGGTGYGTGGVVGWVRYNNDTNSYPYQNIIIVDNCQNTGSVTGSTGVGGIVGEWYACGICVANINQAPMLSTSGVFVAGIVGGSQWVSDGLPPSQPNAVANTPSIDGITPSLDMLFVNNNISTTPMADIKGGSSAQYVYINNSEKTTAKDNTNVLPEESN